MISEQFNRPILFIIFNRPDVTIKVFDQIRKIKPQRLFVAADGPRKEKKREAEKCLETRNIVKNIDWDCKVDTLYREENLGCKRAVSTAISWFFENVEDGIILEDDCLPNQNFFFFCQEMLIKYRNDQRVMHISGDNFQFGEIFGDGSYYFSKMVHVWGWASWRRAWNKYDVSIKSYPLFREQKQLDSIFKDSNLVLYWKRIFESAFENRIDTWDYQWVYSVLCNNGLAIIPNYNLIKNIGFGSDATHTKEQDNLFSNMETEEVSNILHPSFVLVNSEADGNYINRFIFPNSNKKRNIYRKLKGFIRGLL